MALYRGIPVSNVSDCMGRPVFGGTTLKPLHNGTTEMIGAALTVKVRPGDNLFVHKAISIAEPGDVIVVDAGGDLSCAITGEIMALQCEKRGLAGLVVNGAMRDTATLRKSSFPTYAVGVTYRGPTKEMTGEINVTLAIDGMLIEPGDLIIGDADGVLCVPFDHVEALAKASRITQDYEEKVMADLREGKFDDRQWIDDVIARHGAPSNKSSKY
jgi:RraA family protein